jgi:hypothetical protein
MRARTHGLILVCLLASLGGSACATYRDQLSRGERAFEASDHERALAIFRSLEPDIGRLAGPEQAHYAYLRGMTDYRIGYKMEARHWLSLATALEQQTPGSVPAEWAKRMNEALKDLNEEVFTGGIESLSSAAAADKSKTGADTDPSTDPDATKAGKPSPPDKDAP